MLTDTEVQVASGVAPISARRALAVFELSLRAFEIAEFLEHGKRRWIQIRRATDQRRELWR